MRRMDTPHADRGSEPSSKPWDGERLREVRRVVDISQVELDEKSGVSNTEISRYETNSPDSNPTVETLAKLAIALGVPVYALLMPVGFPIPFFSPEAVKVRETIWGPQYQGWTPRLGSHKQVAGNEQKSLPSGTLDGAQRDNGWERDMPEPRAYEAQGQPDVLPVQPADLVRLAESIRGTASSISLAAEELAAAAARLQADDVRRHG